MAPQPQKRTSLRARAAASKPSQNPAPPVITSKPDTKKAKRTLRHENLVTRVRDSGISKASAQNKKRRRPRNKLPAAEDVSGLRDALPELEDEEDGGEWEGFSDTQDEGEVRRRRRKSGGKIVMRSMKNRPGAMKRKRRMEGVEMERFGRNLARMAQPTQNKKESAGDGDDADGGQREKWKALQAFIGGTMERDKLFTGAG